ncbi:hypothetical protein [Pseudoalteromonas marina]|uniref:hypothetical protein n=1 Tax=Pseudoalteromonas marina TaxID=267375 RepID=UPI0023F2D08F|nr:hypothetical protein [Pseudoalteromonas marina]
MELIKSFIPLICILLVWFTIGFYFGNKVKRHKANLITDETTPINSLTLSRGVEPTNYLRKYTIYLDEIVVGEITSGETRHFELPSGKHTISVKVDWCKSESFEFNIIDGHNTKLMCGANYNNWKWMFMYAIKPSNWVYVKVA